MASMGFVGGAALPTAGRRSSVCSVRRRSVCMRATPGTKKARDTTSVWDETVQRLHNAFPEYTVDDVETVLTACAGEELDALEKLASMAGSTKRREEAIQQYGGRVSVLEEGRLRREATGSARDFFKSYVDVEGTYVEEGYVDTQADSMKGFRKAVGGWLSGFKPAKPEDDKARKGESIGRDE